MSADRIMRGDPRSRDVIVKSGSSPEGVYIILEGTAPEEEGGSGNTPVDAPPMIESAECFQGIIISIGFNTNILLLF